MLKGENRTANRVRFDHKHAVNLMGVDGTWRRSCVLLDVSATGAKIEVEGTVDVLQAKEFFLLLSSTGLAFRRCELVWIDGCNAGIRFVQMKPGQKKAESGEKKVESSEKKR
jgi:PilZ domain